MGHFIPVPVVDSSSISHKHKERDDSNDLSEAKKTTTMIH